MAHAPAVSNRPTANFRNFIDPNIFYCFLLCCADLSPQDALQQRAPGLLREGPLVNRRHLYAPPAGFAGGASPPGFLELLSPASGPNGPACTSSILMLPAAVCVLTWWGGGLGRTGNPRSTINFIASEIGIWIAPVESAKGCFTFSNSCSEFRKRVMSTASSVCKRG